MEQTYFRVRKEGRIKKTRDLSAAFREWKNENERWLFISPHDDDIVVGGGLLLQKARSERVPVSILIATDGSMGYCDVSDRDRIVSIRKQETENSFNLLLVDDVRWLGFSDNDLYRFAGRRKAAQGDPAVIEGHTGLQNAFTHAIRAIRPTRIFIPGRTDFHPDHKLVYQEVLISVFHSQGAIWPELGAPLESIPVVYEMAIYSPFEKPPNIRIDGTAEHLERKIQGIRSYISQRQIEAIIDRQRLGGPVEYLRDIDYELYSPDMYNDIFEA